tara:strand:- start:7209 stop:8351 length:1143 start_codon:yes stop_codon:yes gene_type:complete
MRVAAVLLSLIFVAQSFAQTSFTYQGRLESLNTAANGLYDMRFRLYNDASSSTQTGTTQCLNNITIVDGVFTANLDFGAQFAGSQPRFLEIEVRQDTGSACSDPSGFTVLAPRHMITSAPRATAALVATGLVRPDGTGVVNLTNDGLVGISTTAPVARLHVADGDIVAGPLGKEWIFHTRPSFNGEFLHITDADNGVFQFQRGLIVHENGSVGIGAVPDGSRKLFVNGQIGVPPTFRTKSIHGASFLPDVVGRESGWGYYGVSGLRGYGIGAGVFTAPVELPDGCQVQRIDLTFIDDRPTDITLTFGRTSTTTGAVANIASFTTSGVSNAVRVAGVDLGGYGIGNNSNVYWLTANLESFSTNVHQIIAVRIQYTVTSPLP